MFEHGFPPYWSTLKKLIWLVGTGIVGGVTEIWKTVTGTLIHITDALASPVQALSVAIEPLQSGSGDPSPTNVRPITGWTGCEVTRTGANFANVSQATEAKKNGSSLFTLEYLQNGVSFNTSTAGSLYCIWDIGLEIKPEMVDEYLSFSATVSGGNAYMVRSKPDGTWSDYTPVYSGSFAITSGMVGCHVGFQFINGTGANQTATNIQINFGDLALQYEPYSGTTPSVTFPDSAGTVYGGTVDLVSGVLTVDRAKITNSTLANASYDFAVNGVFVLTTSVATLPNNPSTNFVDPDLIASALPTISQTELVFVPRPIGIAHFWGNRIGISSGDTSITTALAFKTWIAENGSDIVYPLATPLTYQLTPQQISTLAGENNIWSDAQSMTVTYKADGVASDVEALNMLLGGTYQNQGNPDDVSDREALQILLGDKS